VLKRLVQIAKEVLMLLKTVRHWDDLRNTGEGKTLIIIGNGPSVRRLDPTKLANLLPPSKADIAFVNGFLHAPPFPVESYNCLYFVSDPLIYRLLKWLADGGPREQIVNSQIIAALFADAPPQARHSLQYDAKSLVNALGMQNIKWFCPSHFAIALSKLGVFSCYQISRLVIPGSWPTVINKIIIKMRMHGPNRFNPLGPAVLNYAILTGISLGYDDIVVIGHNDELKYSNYFIKEGRLYFKYRYFWESDERVYLRDDSWDDFIEAQYKLIEIERCLRRNVKIPIRYLTPSHLHLFLTDPRTPDLMRSIE
jgi:hypothetical protein